MARIVGIFVGLLAVVLCAANAYAQGGPPFLTDDPSTVPCHKWVICTSYTQQTRGGRSLSGIPLLDFNYGLDNHTQVEYLVPWSLTFGSRFETVSGIGDSRFEMKHRFLDQDVHGVNLSVEPQVEFNNSSRSVQQRLVPDGTQFYIPFEVSRTFGKIETDFETGLNFREHGKPQWAYGVIVGYPFTDRLELGVELHGNTLDDMRHHEVDFNVGGRYKLNDTATLLFSAGRCIGRATDGKASLLLYAGVQWTF